MNLINNYGKKKTKKIYSIAKGLFIGNKKGIIVMGSAGAGKEYKRKDVAVDKDRIERLIVQKNKTKDGYYSEEQGFISNESLSELKEIQKTLKTIGIETSLQEAENFWSSYCQDEHFAGWIKFSDFDNSLKEESKKYVFSYFYE